MTFLCKRHTAHSLSRCFPAVITSAFESLVHKIGTTDGFDLQRIFSSLELKVNSDGEEYGTLGAGLYVVSRGLSAQL